MLYPINLQPERDTLDARYISQLIAMWLAHCRLSCDPYTVDGYEQKILHFTEWWDGVAAWRSHELDEDALADFGRWLADQSLSYNSRNDVLRRLRQCLKWAWRKGYAQRDFSVWVPRAEGAAPLRVVAPRDALTRLLTAASQTNAPLRDTAILALFIQTGIRRAECASILIETITMAADSSGTLHVIGKRTKRRPNGERIVAFDVVAGRYLAAWLDATDRTSGPLFVTSAGVGLSAQGIAKVVKRVILAAGLEKTIQGCHDLRRAFVTDWRRRNRGAGYDHLLRMQVGHASDAISDLYDLADLDDLQMAIRGPLSA
jgi:site-specific recombinase XerD